MELRVLWNLTIIKHIVVATPINHPPPITTTPASLQPPTPPAPNAARPVFCQPPPEGHLTEPTNRLLHLNLSWILRLIFMLPTAFWLKNQFPVQVCMYISPQTTLLEAKSDFLNTQSWGNLKLKISLVHYILTAMVFSRGYKYPLGYVKTDLLVKERNFSIFNFLCLLS